MEVIEFFKKIDARISRMYQDSNILSLWFSARQAREFSEYFEDINNVFDCSLIGGDLCIDFNINDTEELFGTSFTNKDFEELEND